MTINLDNIKMHEFIGLFTKIIRSKNKNLIGMIGKIVDESRSTITIEINNEYKQIQKKHNIWKFFFNNDNQHIIIDGNEINKRPEERLFIK